MVRKGRKVNLEPMENQEDKAWEVVIVIVIVIISLEMNVTALYDAAADHSA